MRPHLPVRRLFVEQLENRLVLAGNVLAEVTGSTLRITGDQFDNSLSIVGYLGGGVSVLGFDTSVNGGTDGLFFSGVDRVEISTGDGDDQIGSTWSFAVDVIFDMGHGNDYVSATAWYMVGNLTIATGDGNDRIDLKTPLHTGSVQIDSGNGNDIIQVALTLIEGDLAIDAGNGNDVVVLSAWGSDHTGRILGDLTIDGGNGRSDVLHGTMSPRFLFEFEGDVSISGFESID